MYFLSSVLVLLIVKQLGELSSQVNLKFLRDLKRIVVENSYSFCKSMHNIKKLQAQSYVNNAASNCPKSPPFLLIKSFFWSPYSFLMKCLLGSHSSESIC